MVLFFFFSLSAPPPPPPPPDQLYEVKSSISLDRDAARVSQSAILRSGCAVVYETTVVSEHVGFGRSILSDPAIIIF